jgi:hypothetical protein
VRDPREQAGWEGAILWALLVAGPTHIDRSDRREHCAICRRGYDHRDMVVVKSADPSAGSACLECAVHTWCSHARCMRSRGGA